MEKLNLPSNIKNLLVHLHFEVFQIRVEVGCSYDLFFGFRGEFCRKKLN